MSIRKTILSLALLGAVAAPAFANSSSYVSERGEAAYSGPMPGEMVKQTPRAASVFEGSGSGYASERGEATYSGPTPGNTAQRKSGANSRAMGASSGMALSRAQVLEDLKAFLRSNPVTADGP